MKKVVLPTFNRETNNFLIEGNIITCPECHGKQFIVRATQAHVLGICQKLNCPGKFIIYSIAAIEDPSFVDPQNIDKLLENIPLRLAISTKPEVKINVLEL
jgi:hypothetical protein